MQIWIVLGLFVEYGKTGGEGIDVNERFLVGAM
jgi:hypothetical protein